MINTKLSDAMPLDKAGVQASPESIQMKNRNDKSLHTGAGVDGKEVIAYKLFGQKFVESKERFWRRLENHFPVETQPDGSECMKPEQLQIYDQKAGYVRCARVSRTLRSDWHQVKLSNGRALMYACGKEEQLTDESMCDSNSVAGEMQNGIIEIDHSNGIVADFAGYDYNACRAWMLAMVLCDGSYSESIVVSVAGEDEDDIAEKLGEIWRQEYGYGAVTKHQHRGVKGDYKDVRMDLAGANKKEVNYAIRAMLISEFGGIRKLSRQIPPEIFRSSRKAQLAFLAGMIDADGYLDDKSITIVQLGSTNKELALQQLLLAQALDMPASLYLGEYFVDGKKKIRYRVEFVPSDELMEYIVCEKKKTHLGNTIRTKNSIRTKDTAEVKAVTTLYKEDYAYRVVTETGHYTVSGIWCQTDADI